MKKLTEFLIIILLMAGILAGVVEYGQVGSLEGIANLVNVFSGVEWFLGSFLIATLFTAYLVVIANTTVVLRFLAIPAWLVFSISLLVTVDQFMGYSYPAVPPKAKVLAYYVVPGLGQSKTIEAWMYLKDEGRARAYNFPYTLEREEALYEALAATRKGENAELDLRRGNNAEDDGQEPESMITYDFSVDPDPPGKNYNGAVPDTMPEDGQIYQQNDDGEIEIIQPKKKTQKNNWPATPGQQNFYSYRWDNDFDDFEE